jgi:MFS family permease
VPTASQWALELHRPLLRGSALRLKSWISDKELSRDFWIFFFAALCFDFGFAMYLFLFNLFLLDLGFNERQLGLVAGAMTIGGVVATIPMGLLAKRMGLHRVLLAGFILTPFLFAVRTVVAGERAQIAVAFLAGMSLCYWAVSFAPSAAKLTTKKNRPFAFSLLLSVGIGTGGLAGLVGGFLPGRLQSLNPSMQPADAKRIALLLCCVIASLGAWPVSRLRLHVEQVKRSRPWKMDPFLFRFLPAMAMWSLAAGAFTPFATAYLSRYVRIPLTHIGVIFSASQLAQVAAVLMAPAVFKRCGLVAGITYTQIVTAIALGALARAHSVPLIVVLYLSFSAFHWMGGPGIYSLLMNRVAEGERSNASAANSLVTSLCQAVASAVAGAAYVNFGYPAVLTGVGVVALLAALLFWVLLRDSRDENVTLTAPVES